MDHSPRVLKSPSAWFSLGFLATICQVLLLRDFLVFCTGSELGIAVLLCTWLAGIAAGAGFSRPLLRSSLSPGVILPICLTLLAFSCPASLTLVRSAGLFVETPAGTLAPLGQLLFIALAAALPPGLLVGITFPLACATESEPSGPEPPHPESGALTIGRVYALEAAGSVSAGLVHTWLLVTLLPAMQTALLSGAALCLAAAWQSRRLGGSLKRGRLLTAGRRSAATAGLLMLIAGLIPALGGRLDRLTLEQRWHSLHPGLELLLTLETPHQRLEVGRLGDQTVFLSNGAVLSTYPDPWVADLWGHLVLSVHPSPRRILLAGGLESGLLAAMLRHPGVEKIRLVEQDPALPALFGRYATGQDRLALTNPRFTLDTGDGRRLINRMAAGLPDHSAGEWDMIVILLPDPTTAMINRYYTREFYAACRRLLRPGGILLCRVTASANYLEGEAGALARSVHATLCHVFPTVQAAGGDRLILAASSRAADPDFFSAKQLIGHFEESGAIDPEFSPLIFHSLVEEDRSRYLKTQLVTEPDSGTGGVNSDWHPQAQLHTLRLWSRFSGDSLDPLFRLIFLPTPSWLVAAAVALPLIWALAPLAVRSRRRIMGINRGTVLAAVTAAGFTGLSLELVCIYVYQGAFGNLYRMIGSLVALFMLGLALGGAGAVPLGRWLTGRRKAGLRRVLILALSGQALIAFCVPAALGLLVSKHLLFAASIVSEGLVLLLAGAAGWFTGLALPAAGGMLIGDGPPSAPGRTASASAQVNSADHLGAMAAAALIGLAAIPRLGVLATAGLLALITVCCALRLALERTGARQSC